MTWLDIVPLHRVAQVPSLTELTWSCMVCGDERPDARVSVAHMRFAALEDHQVRVRYCNDRSACRSVIGRTEVWPPPVPVLQADQVLRLTPAALTDRAWETRDLNELASGILRWLRDESAPIQTLLNSYDQSAQDIFDTCRSLVGVGLVEVAPVTAAPAWQADDPIPHPPAGWVELAGPGPFTDVITNFDHSIDEDVAEKLREGGTFARHAAWNFNGLVWFDGGRWHERVSVYGQTRNAYTADTLEQLRQIVNDEFGWQ